MLVDGWPQVAEALELPLPRLPRLLHGQFGRESYPMAGAVRALVRQSTILPDEWLGSETLPSPETRSALQIGSGERRLDLT